MDNFLLLLFQLAVIVLFIAIYIIAVRALRPLMIHRYRKWSTLLFKFSYLLYLALLFVLLFYMIFYDDSILSNTEIPEKSLVLFFIYFIIPNMAIFVRRKVKFNRVFYNYVFFGVYLLLIIFMVRMLVSG
jgi:hypothetical protein